MAETYTPHYNWTKPSLGGDANTWGSVLNSTIDKIDSQVFSLNGQVGATTFSIARGPDGGAYGSLTFTNVAIAPALIGTQPRWVLYETSETESGGNAGTNFGLNAYSDSGAYLGNAFTIARATLATTFGGAVTINGSLTNTGNATVNGSLTTNNGLTANTINCPTFYSNPTFTGNVTVNANLIGNSQITANANLVVQGIAYIAYNTTGGGLGYGPYSLSADSSARYLHYATSWFWTWRNSDGLLSWSTLGGPGATEWAPFQIDVAGNVSYAGALIHISDAAAKENITSFEGDPLAIIKAIPVRRYNLVEKVEFHLGFIAQEVRAMMPEAVMPTKDGVLGVAQEPLIAMLWSAVQKLTERVQELESRFSP